MEISLDRFYGKPEDDLDKVITVNGVYSYDPEDGHVFGNARIEVDVHPTERFEVTLTENGTTTYAGEYAGVEITTDIHPTEKFEVTLTENGTTTYTGEYAGAEITVDIDTGITPTGEINISANGNYDVTQYATANVNVPSSGGGSEYSYFDGSIDEAGLRAIGWDDASIGMYRDNTRIYSWQNNDYKVSDENKALYGVVNSSSNMNGQIGMKYCPMFDTSNVTSMYNMFRECSLLTSIPQLDPSKVTDMGSMFYECSSLTSIPQLDTSKVTDMSYMFSFCSSLTSIPQLDTSNVTNMGYMFSGCSSLASIPLLDTSKVTDMRQMFQNCSILASIPLLDTSNVTDMNNMFYQCKALTSIPLLDTSNVTDMSQMFRNCSLLTSIPQLDTSNVTNMERMFESCSSLTSIPMLDTSKVMNMSYMFSGCSKLTSLPLLDTSCVMKISYFFGYGNITTLTDLGGFKDLMINWSDTYGLAKCPNLTYESVMNVINNLFDFVGNGSSETRTIRLHANSKALLSDADIAIATNKGWIIS